MMKNLNSVNFGIIEVMPNNNDNINPEYYDKFLEDVASISGEGWKVSDYKIAKYIIELGKSYNIWESIFDNYGYRFITEIVADIDNNWGGTKSFIIDDPQEIRAFLYGDYAIGYDSNWNKFEISKDSSALLNWEEQTGIYFIVRSI